MTDQSRRAAEAWAWAHPDATDSIAHVPASNVTAVVVVHNAAEWLPRTLAALSRLSPRPGTLVAVDAGSSDTSREILDRAPRRGPVSMVVAGDADAGFGVNVAIGLDHVPVTDWVWLLHDDVEPRSDCLEILLQAAAADPAPDVLVPKLLHPPRRNYPDRLSEIGQSLSRTGRRVSSVSLGDIDQDQDDAAPTLGGSTAGMLVRREVWDDLGGLDAELPLFVDGLDFGWRANDAGHRVVTCPRAGLHHRRVGRLGERKQALTDAPSTLARTLSLRLAVARSARPRLATVWALLVALLRAFGYLLGKALTPAADELRAAWALLTRRREVLALRDRAGGRSASDQLRPGPFAGALDAVDKTAAAFTDRYRELREDSGTSLDELTGDDWAGGMRRRRWLSPWLAMTLAALLVAAVSARDLLASGRLVGPVLLPAPAGLTAAWDAWWHSTPGLAGANAPWLALSAFGSTLAFGRPDWFAFAWLVLGPLLAAWSAHRFARHVVPGWPAALLALAWGLVLPLSGATGRGSLAAVLLAVLLPVVARGIQLWTRRPSVGIDALRAPSVIALGLTALAACWPVAWLVGVVVAAVVVRVRPPLWRGLVIVALGPLVVLAPWFPRLWLEPARLLAGPDPLAERLTDGASGVPAAAAMVGFCLAAGVGVLVHLGGRGFQRASALALLAVTSLAATAWLPKLVLTLERLPVRPDATPWRLLAVGCLMILLTQAALRAPEGKTGLAVVAGLATAVIAAGGWAAHSGTQGLTRSVSVLPAHVQNAMAEPRNSRVLLVDITDQMSWNVVSATTPQWGSGEADPTGLTAGDAAVAAGVAQAFASGQPADDLGARLTSLGISHVWLRGQRPDEVASLANAAGLSHAQLTDGATLWLVTPPVSRTMDAPRGQGWAAWQGAGVILLLILAAPSARPPLSPRRLDSIEVRHA